jgi:hypothetical protein
MNESTATAIVLKKLRERYPGIFVQKITLAIGAGFPDAILVMNGTTVFIEFKGKATPITRLQQAVMDRLDRNGAKVIIVRFTGGPRQEHMVSTLRGKHACDLYGYLEQTCRA